MQRSLGILALTAALIGGLALGLLGSPSTAQAQGNRDRARQLYTQGQQLFEAGQYEQAQAAFEEAYREVSIPVVLQAIAQAQERRGLVTDAIASYERYLQGSPDAANRAEIESRLQRLRTFPAMVTIESTPPGASVALDGQATGRVTPTQMQIPGGRHRITFALNNHETTQEVEITPATHPTINADLSAFAAPQGGGQGGGDPLGQQGGGDEQGGGEQGGGEQGGGSGEVHPAVWATAGIGVAGLIAGTVCGFLALSEQSNYDAMPTAEIADRGETYALVADISFGVAGAGAIAALIIFLVDSASGGGEDQADAPSGDQAGAQSALGTLPAPELTLTPLVDPNGGGLSARLRF